MERHTGTARTPDHRKQAAIDSLGVQADELGQPTTNKNKKPERTWVRSGFVAVLPADAFGGRSKNWWPKRSGRPEAMSSGKRRIFQSLAERQRRPQRR
jgi:hypothetical protein